MLKSPKSRGSVHPILRWMIPKGLIYRQSGESSDLKSSVALNSILLIFRLLIGNFGCERCSGYCKAGTNFFGNQFGSSCYK